MWARAAPILERALEHAHGSHTLEDVKKGVMAGALNLWVGEKSAAVSEFLTFPQVRALNLFLAAGDLDELHQALPGIEAFARGGGCERLMFSGRLDPSDGRRARSGWEVLMPGFTPTHIALCKELA